MSRDTLTVTDNRTGLSFEVPIKHGSIRATDLVGPFISPRGYGIVIYDPGLAHTAACRSSITNIELRAGVLEHRGYRIEALAEHSTYIEVAYLMIYGELPTAAELDRWRSELARRMVVHENVKGFIKGFRYDAHPMAMVAAAVGALGSFYPDADAVTDAAVRELQIRRMVAKMPTLVAYSYRHGMGRPFVYPSNELSYAGNVLSMLFRMSELEYLPDPVIERALDVLLIVHADHEQTASTTAVRAVGSTHVNPYAAIAAGVASLSGPGRGSADLAVLEMLAEIGSPDRVPAFLEQVKAGERPLMGFGHWVYKSLDPRAPILRDELDRINEHRPANPLLAVADALRARSQDDEYFVSRRIFPNVDLYSGLIYDAIGVPPPMFGVMFALARSAGWIAQWREMVEDPEQDLIRPRQVWIGPSQREYVALDERD